jgi:hypothetical protein
LGFHQLIVYKKLTHLVTILHLNSIKRVEITGIFVESPPFNNPRQIPIKNSLSAASFSSIWGFMCPVFYIVFKEEMLLQYNLYFYDSCYLLKVMNRSPKINISERHIGLIHPLKFVALGAET